MNERPPRKLRELVSAVQEHLGALGAQLGPGDDWPPVCAYVGDRGLCFTVIDPELVQSDERKAFLAIELAVLAGREHASLMAYAFSGWLRTGTQVTDGERRDVVVIVGAARGRGRAVISEEGLSTAQVERSDSAPPRLGPWTTHIDAEATVAGRFHDAIALAFGTAVFYDHIAALARQLRLNEHEAEHHLRRGLARAMGIDPDTLPRRVEASGMRMS